MGYSPQTLHSVRQRHGGLDWQKTRGGRRWEGGGNYIPNVAIGMRNRALIGIDQVCCKSPTRRKAPSQFITLLALLRTIMPIGFG